MRKELEKVNKNRPASVPEESKNRLTKLQKNGKLKKTITGMETELNE